MQPDSPPPPSSSAPLVSPVQPDSSPSAGPSAASTPLGSPVQSEVTSRSAPRGGREPGSPATPTKPGPAAPGDDLLAQALEDPAVQTMLDVFPAEIKEVEEM